jgi:hypothetical protein
MMTDEEFHEDPFAKIYLQGNKPYVPPTTSEITPSKKMKNVLKLI